MAMLVSSHTNFAPAPASPRLLSWPTPGRSCLTAVPCFLAALLVIGCESRGPTLQVTPEPVVWPALARLVDEGIRDLILESRREVEALQADPDTDPTDLGLAYGRAGMVLMAHDLHSAARPAIANAAVYLPDDLRWVYYLGYIDVRIGDPGSAQDAFSTVLASQPDHIGSHLSLAELEAETGQLESARQRLEMVLTLDATTARAYELLGDLAAESNEAPIAIAHYLAALQLQPEATRLHAKMAPLYFAAGMEDESRIHEASSGSLPTHYDEPLIIDVIRHNRSATFFVDQGVRFVDAGRLEEAIQHFQRAVSMDPDHVLGLTNLALAHFEAGDLNAALETGRRSVAAAVAKRGTDEGAGARTESRAHLQLASFLLSAGRPAEAESLYLEAIAIEPDNDSARLEFARYLRRADRCHDALEHYLQAETSASPAAGVVPSVVPVETALCLVRTGRDADARSHLEEWIERRPDDAELRDALIRILAASPDDTVRDGHRALELTAAAESDDPGVDTLETLAMAHAELHDFERAIEAQERAIALADEQDRDAWLIVLNSALESYREGRPNRQPWPDFMFAP